MQICRTVAEMRDVSEALRGKGSVALVPTMGALHAGHEKLVQAACDAHPNTVASIFVNPTQFGNPEDLEKYPRTEETDLAILDRAGVAAVFMPSTVEMYPADEETIVETTRLAQKFHGEVRPGHFRGVATVVTKLFHITQADVAYFGMKDYQQLAVIRRMVRDLHFPIEIRGVETVRDHDGLALSSRNVRLTPEDRAAAPVLYAALSHGEAELRAGKTVEAAIAMIQRIVGAESRATLKAIDVVDAETFLPAKGVPSEKVGMMISALFGDVLLIDQKEFTP